MGSGQVIYEFRGPFGVRVQIMSSLIFLAFMMVGFRLNSGQDLLWSLAVFAILALSIFLHELGHAWGCTVQRVPVRRIVLHAAGGFCERAMSATPRQQELIVAMGPIVNLTIWAVASLLSNWLWGMDAQSDVEASEGFYRFLWLLDTAARMNLFLALFNLLPVQPLDGGKLFQLGLMRLCDTRMATRIAGCVGLVFAVLWFPAMVYLYVTFGWVLFFIPSIRTHYDMARLREYRHLKRWD